MWMLSTLGTYVMGAALREIQELRWHRGLEENTEDLSEAEVEALRDEFDAADPPVGALPEPDDDHGRELRPGRAGDSHDRFWFGLGCLLDGFAAAIARAG